ncbi:unnamed protein product [Ascophyllum nodosum]
MHLNDTMSPIIDTGKLALERFVQWNVDNEWIASKTLLLVSPGQGLDAKALELADTIGFEADSMKYVLLLLAAYPLAAVFARLPNATAKHAFSVLVGIWTMQFVFYSQWIHSFISSTVTYLMVLFLPNKYMPHIVFLFVMGYICVSHIYRMYVDYMGWSLDFTGPQMVLTIKLSSFAYNVWDGRKWAEIEKDTGNKKKDRTLAARRKYALRTVPNVLEFYGYIYCFSSILAGPAFEYTEYHSATSGKAFEKDGKPAPMPSNWRPAMIKLLSGLCCLGLFQFGGPQFPLWMMRQKQAAGVAMQARIAQAWCTTLFVRMKYYFAWKTADGASVLGGFGFEGYDKEGKVVGWHGVSNMDILGFETAGHISSNTRAWNKRSQGWLERYVYMRTGNSLLATYFVSAFWHGFYPGYYLFFMSLPMITAVARVGKKKISPYFPGGTMIGSVYQALCVVVVSLTVNYCVIPFPMLGLVESLDVWRTFYFGIHAMAIVLYLICLCIPTKKVTNGSKPKTS